MPLKIVLANREFVVSVLALLVLDDPSRLICRKAFEHGGNAGPDVPTANLYREWDPCVQGASNAWRALSGVALSGGSASRLRTADRPSVMEPSTPVRDGRSPHSPNQ